MHTSHAKLLIVLLTGMVVVSGCGGGSGSGSPSALDNPISTVISGTTLAGTTDTGTATTGSTTSSATSTTPVPTTTGTTTGFPSTTGTTSSNGPSLVGSWSGLANDTMGGILTIKSDGTLTGQFTDADGTVARINGNWSQYFSSSDKVGATVTGTYSTLATGTLSLYNTSVIYIDLTNVSGNRLEGVIFALQNGQSNLVLSLDLARSG